MSQSGNDQKKIKLIFERTTDASVLSNFSCGIQSMDSFIHSELQDYIGMGSCEMYIVSYDSTIIGMFCLDNSTITFSEEAKTNMREGNKPKPMNTSKDEDSYYWWKTSYEAKEITYFAISKEYQRQRIGSFIIESIADKISKDDSFNGDYIIVRALNEDNYSAIPFYKKCGFVPAMEERKNQNLFMYRLKKRE